VKLRSAQPLMTRTTTVRLGDEAYGNNVVLVTSRVADRRPSVDGRGPAGGEPPPLAARQTTTRASEARLKFKSAPGPREWRRSGGGWLGDQPSAARIPTFTRR
jgi:hypothetical protein